MAKDDLRWSTYNEALGGWQKCTDLKGRTMLIQPDMDKSRWFWQVVWSAEHEKWDKKKGEIIPGKSAVVAWGTSPTRGDARADALARAERPRPRKKREHSAQEEMFND